MTTMLLVILLMTSCKKEVKESMNFQKLCGISPDNTVNADSPELNRYSLKQLSDYFGEYSGQELSVYDNETKSYDFSFNKVNKYFPIQILRYNQNNYYSIYPVSEGGFFYVFWSKNNDEASVEDTFYIDKLKNRADFKDLQIGVSSYADVYEIDKASELILIMSNGVFSYHVLENDTILKIKYKFEDITNRKDLLVESINEISAKKPNGSFLQSILNKDIPR